MKKTPYLLPHILASFIFLVTLPLQINAEILLVKPTDNLQQQLDDSQDGDTILLGAGRYTGNFIINKQITLRGENQANNKTIIDAQGISHGLTLNNSHIILDHLTIVNWGDSLVEQHAGIYVNGKDLNKKITNIIIKNNTLIGDGFGILLSYASNSAIFNNTVEGNLSRQSAKRGNGIQLENTHQSHVYHNDIFNVRDGIYVISSQHNLIKNNTMHELRYGIHYMYSYDDTIKNNLVYNTRAGYALMSSERLTVTGNKTRDNQDYGILLNFMRHSTLTQNDIHTVWPKKENQMLGRSGKGLFVYNSKDNIFSDNVVENAEIAIHLTAGSENISIYANSFINNPTQVKYVSHTKQEWSNNGRGNYWSNYLGWDMNNDGVGDAIYEPNESIDKLVWQYPEMKTLMSSPAILILRWVQKQFPVLKPPGVKDSYPLMVRPKAVKTEKGNKELSYE